MRKLDGKYHITNDNIVNTSTGEVIPEDEPLFLFRARDGLAVLAIRRYFDYCAEGGCNLKQRDGVLRTIEKFLQYEKVKPEEMRLPGYEPRNPKGTTSE